MNETQARKRSGWSEMEVLSQTAARPALEPAVGRISFTKFLLQKRGLKNKKTLLAVSMPEPINAAPFHQGSGGPERFERTFSH